jgi:hypothetical protein
MAVAARQRGWVGIIALLLVVCVVAVMASTLLKSLMPSGKSSADRSAPRVPAGGLDPVDSASATAPPPGDALERARGVQDAVREQAADLQKRIDAQDK